MLLSAESSTARRRGRGRPRRVSCSVGVGALEPGPPWARWRCLALGRRRAHPIGRGCDGGRQHQWQGRSVISKAVSLLDAFGPTSPTSPSATSPGSPGCRCPPPTGWCRSSSSWGGLERAAGGTGYRIGVRLWQLGALAPRGATLREVALPHMQDLYHATGENVHLAVLDGHEALYLDTIAGRGAVPVRSRRGGRLPLHATGVGKVLLAHAPELLPERVEAGLRRYTPHTVVAPADTCAGRSPRRRTGVGYARQEMSLGSQSRRRRGGRVRGGRRGAGRGAAQRPGRDPSTRAPRCGPPPSPSPGCCTNARAPVRRRRAPPAREPREGARYGEPQRGSPRGSPAPGRSPWPLSYDHPRATDMRYTPGRGRTYVRVARGGWRTRLRCSQAECVCGRVCSAPWSERPRCVRSRSGRQNWAAGELGSRELGSRELSGKELRASAGVCGARAAGEGAGQGGQRRGHRRSPPLTPVIVDHVPRVIVVWVHADTWRMRDRT